MPTISQAAAVRFEELDRVTLARAQRGQRDAQRRLIEHYQRAVLACAYRLLATSRHGARRAHAEDLAQETFVRVLGAIDRFDPNGTARLSTWILTIATRVTLNELRRAVPADVVPPMQNEGERPDRAAEQQQASELVRRAIDALPAEQRTVVVLREYHDLDYGEIAAALEVDLGTVKSRLSRARDALRASLAEVRS